MKFLLHCRCVRARVLAAVVAACAVVAAIRAGDARAAVWTASSSANWASPGGWNGTTASTNWVLQGLSLSNATSGNFGPTPLASTTATLQTGTSSNDIRTSRLTYDFTISPGSGNTLNWTNGIYILTDNSDQNNVLHFANRVDITVLAPVQITGANGNYMNGGDAGTMRLMGNISQDASTRTMAIRGNYVIGGSNSYAGATTLAAGNVTLDYDNSNATKFSDTAALTMGNGNVALTLKGGSHTEVVTGVSFRSGDFSIRRSGGSSMLSAGGVSFNAGSALDIGLDGLMTTTSANTRGIIGGGVARATVGGTSWATVTSGTVVGLTTYGTDDFSSNTNTDVTTTAALGSAFTTNSLRFNTAAATTLTLTGSNQLQAGGILVTPNVGGLSTTITGGTLASPGQIVIHQHNTAGRLDIGANLNLNNGLVKSGSGVVRFSNATANSGTGANAAVAINQGVVELHTTENAFGAGPIRVNGGEIHNSLGGNVTISNTMTLGPDEAQGFNARVGFGGVSSGTITLSGNVSLAGSSANYKQLRLHVADGVTLRSTGTTSSSSGPTLVKTGSGTWVVESAGSVGDNTGAPVVVREGILRLAGSAGWNSTGVNLWGGVFELNNEAVSSNTRVQQLNAFGGAFRLVGNATVVTTETATVFLRNGHSTFTVVSNGTTTTLQTTRFGSINGGAESDLTTTVLLRGSGLGSGSTGAVARIMGDTVTAAGSSASGSPNGWASTGQFTTGAQVAPWAIADSSATGSGETLATFVAGVNGGNGWRPLITSGTGMEVTATPTASVNNRYTAATTLTGASLSVNSLMLDGGMTLNSSNGAGTALTVSSGGLMSTGGTNTIDSTVRLAAGSGNYGLIFHTVSDLNIAGTLGASGTAQQLLKSSAGTLRLSGSSARATGNTFVNQGVLSVSSDSGLYDMSTFSGTAQINRVVTVWGRGGSDTGVLELAGVNWTTNSSRTPTIVLQGNNATLRGSGTSSYGNGGAAYLSAYGDVFLESLGAESVFTLNSPISRDSGLDTTINVKGAGKVVLGANAGNALEGTSRGNAAMDWYIGGSRNGNDGWLAVNTETAVGLASNTFYVGNGGMLSGGGIIGSAVVIQDGGVISPGNSTGTLTEGATTFESGGRFRFEINDPDFAAGATDLGWDLLQVPTLAIDATTASPFYIDMVSLTAEQTAGTLANFNENFGGYEWLFVEAAAEIPVFDPGVFQFNVAQFQTPNGLAPGSFFQVRRGTAGGVELNKLFITYSVPEPGTLALVGMAGVLLAARQVRRRRPAA